MARGTAYVVFVIPVIFTIVFGFTVLASALDSLDRELNMWPAGSHDLGSSIAVLGLQEEYTGNEVVEFSLYVEDELGCRDITVLVYNSVGDIVAEDLYQAQCILDGSQRLMLDGFLASDVEPGSYTITAMMDIHGNQLIDSVVFYIR